MRGRWRVWNKQEPYSRRSDSVIDLYAADPQIRSEAFTGTGAGNRAQRRISGPAVNRRYHEERGEQHDEGHEGGPERKHVEGGERHVRRANLDGQKIIPEAALRGGGE